MSKNLEMMYVRYFWPCTALDRYTYTGGNTWTHASPGNSVPRLGTAWLRGWNCKVKRRNLKVQETPLRMGALFFLAHVTF